MTRMKLSPAHTAVTKRPATATSEASSTCGHVATGQEQAGQRVEACGLNQIESEATGTLRISKLDTNLRELKTSDEALDFELIAHLGSNAYQAAHLCTEAATQIFHARCSSNAHRDLRNCVVKLTNDTELAHNEWDHLSNMRSSAFPMGFVFGKVLDHQSACEGKSAPRLAIVMELIEGEALSTLIARGFGSEGKPAPVEKALEIMSPLAGAFHDLALSLHPFVHRDVKPDNIIVSKSQGKRRTRIIDVGVSSHMGDPRQREHLGCSEGFAAPEIARPQDYPAGCLFSIDDARIDTYGLAATFYALVTGHAPSGDKPIIDATHLSHDADTLDDIKATAKKAIFEKHRIDVEDERLTQLIGQVIRKHDEAFVDALTRGLTFLQSERPTPVEFFALLPTNYRTTIVNDVHLLFLEDLVAKRPTSAHGRSAKSKLVSIHLGEDESVDLQDTALADEYRYPDFQDDFHQAMALYNAGRYAEAIPLLKKLDEAGDATSSYNLGVCYKDGLGGLQRDDTRKLACWTRAAEGGHVMAVYNVGLCHEEGLGIPQSPTSRNAAMAWYERAAEMGLPAAADSLARLRSQTA